MPVTLKFSKEFYDRLGTGVVNELVESLNVIDTSYRQEFRELFEAHFGRLETRLDALEARVDRKVDTQVFEARLDAKLEALKSELLRWMFLFWVGTMGTVLAIVKL